MIDVISTKIAVRIKEENPEHPASIAVLRYAIAAVINIFGTLLLAIGLAIYLGHLPSTMLSLASFALLRMISGGYHLNSSAACILVTAVAANLIPYIDLTVPVTLSFTLTSMLLAFFFAPSNLERTSRIPYRYYPLIKYVAILIIATNLLILSDVIALSFLIQCLSLVQIRR